MKNRLITLLIIAIMVVTASIWGFIAIVYWLFAGKSWPLLDKTIDYLSDLND